MSPVQGHVACLNLLLTGPHHSQDDDDDDDNCDDSGDGDNY